MKNEMLSAHCELGRYRTKTISERTSCHSRTLLQDFEDSPIDHSPCYLSASWWLLSCQRSGTKITITGQCLYRG
ncbi:hypothetical protein ONS95_015059 [Cadophora gregata]|uniref:uncharacterized protein n=1 Tax=Cadophora gregata TaxID=51156 RepID=UPI0026DB2110|nr:uncharacterized protein ONS95_015059 [Cadophora gregata]KAK0120025.1 hypothetical protein ONS95_015059 [Cadophora gregata]